MIEITPAEFKSLGKIEEVVACCEPIDFNLISRKQGSGGLKTRFRSLFGNRFEYSKVAEPGDLGRLDAKLTARTGKTFLQEFRNTPKFPIDVVCAPIQHSPSNEVSGFLLCLAHWICSSIEQNGCQPFLCLGSQRVAATGIEVVAQTLFRDASREDFIDSIESESFFRVIILDHRMLWMVNDDLESVLSTIVADGVPAIIFAVLSRKELTRSWFGNVVGGKDLHSIDTWNTMLSRWSQLCRAEQVEFYPVVPFGNWNSLPDFVDYVLMQLSE